MNERTSMRTPRSLETLKHVRVQRSLLRTLSIVPQIRLRIYGAAAAFAQMVVVVALFASVSRAATPTTGAPLLRFSGSARSAALQGARTASAGDIDGIFYNPGGLAALGRHQAGFTHAELASGASYDLAEAGGPTGFGGFGVSVSRIGYGAIEGRDENQRETGNVGAEDLLGSVALSENFSGRFGVGVNAKYLQSRLADARASTLAYDVGVVGRVPGQSLWLGAAALNLGPGLRFINQEEALPLTVAAGVAAQLQGALTISFDVKHEPRDRRSEAGVGLEWAVSNLTLRGGYGLPVLSNAGPSAAFDNLEGGIGVKLSTFRLDYAVTPQHAEGLTHRFTLSSVF